MLLFLLGKKVIIHIATKGHGVGYMEYPNFGPVFSKTKLRITLYDTYRNVEKSVILIRFQNRLIILIDSFLWDGRRVWFHGLQPLAPILEFVDCTS